MREFFEVLLVLILMLAAFVMGVILVGKTPTYKIGQDAAVLIEQCELSLPRDEFCELVARPQGAE